MATRTFPSSKSSLFAVTGSNELGGGKDDHLPVGGPYNGYTFRAAIAFDLDWSGMKSITSAVLKLRTSGRVHVAFSSAPDFYVARATEGWTANSGKSSADSGGGPGWSTSPDVYPGPSATTTGRVSKRAPTAEATWFDTDITGIVRAWAPTSVEGGQNAGKYGLLLYGVASGDVTEFQSHESTYHPDIVVTYTTDSPPPAPTITGPTGSGTSLRPTLTATAVDPDGDPLEVGDVEVYKGAAVVYSATGVAAASATTLSHIPTADLPSGVLGVRWRARANGVYGAWSAQGAFTIDRPPSVTSWSAPAASVSGTLRPVHTWVSTDPDGDALTAWDLEVFNTSGGVPTGSPVYQRLGQNTGITGYTISHTPAADLPGGALAARSRVLANGVWSAWSAYRAYTIVTANPSVTWVWPPVPGGPLLFLAPHVTPPADMHTATVRVQVDVNAPAGHTLTKVNRVIVRNDGPGAPQTIVTGDLIPPGGATNYYASMPFNVATWGGQMWGQVTVTITATSSNGGVTATTRTARWAMGEWYGAVFLGDNVTALATTETPPQATNGQMAALPGETQTTFYRAQSGPVTPAGAAPWRHQALATVRGELPAVGAYLGIATRLYHPANDADLLGGIGSFEDSSLAGWITSAQTVSIAFGGAPDGARVLRVTGNGVANYPACSSQTTPVVPGAWYVLKATAKRATGTVNARVRVDLWKAGAYVSTGANLQYTTGAFVAQTSAAFQVPPDGSVDGMRVLCFIDAPAAAATEAWDFDAVTMTGPTPAVGGMDRIKVDWTSAG